MVEDTVFSGCDSVGLKVLLGNCVLKNSKLHGNTWGLDVRYGKCDVTCCQVYDNKKIGVGVGGAGNIKLMRNEIFHNDRHGIYLDEKSSAVINDNEIFENGWWGISTISDARCSVSHNKIYQNKCGGINLVPISKATGQEQSNTVKSNKIFSNHGPGIIEENKYDDKFGNDTLLPTDVSFSSEDFIKAKLSENELQDNIEKGRDPPSQEVHDICFFCYKKEKLKKCTKCFTAGYCNPECQKSNWKKHKKICYQLFAKYSRLVKILPLSTGLIGDKIVKSSEYEIKAPFSWLEPSGPEHAKAPEHGKRFIVKIQACDGWRSSNAEGTLFAIEDHSLTINGDLDEQEHSCIYHLVRECGSNCNSYGWKKKFFWALLGERETVRLFTSEFPLYQRW